MGNSGNGGLQTGGSPADALGAIAVGSVDDIDTSKYFPQEPVDNKIFYWTRATFGE